jgi:hypothetical protein
MNKSIEQVKVLLQKHRELLEENNATEAYNFNVFNFFKIGENKTSEILAYFLDPNETHGQGDVFLRSFMEDVLKLNREFESNKVRVKCEKIIENNRRLDIRIDLGDYTIAIET